MNSGSKIISSLNSSLLLILLLSLSWSTGALSQPLATGLPVYDSSTGILHIPTVEYQEELFWIDLLYNAGNNTAALVDSDLADWISDFATFDPLTGKLNINYVGVTGTIPPDTSRYAVDLSLVNETPEITFQLDSVRRHFLQITRIPDNRIGMIITNEEGQRLLLFGEPASLENFVPQGGIFIPDAGYPNTIFLDQNFLPDAIVQGSYAVFFTNHRDNTVDITRVRSSDALEFPGQAADFPGWPELSDSNANLAGLADTFVESACTSLGIPEMLEGATPTFPVRLRRVCNSHLLLTASNLLNVTLFEDLSDVTAEQVCSIEENGVNGSAVCSSDILTNINNANAILQQSEMTLKMARAQLPPMVVDVTPTITSFSASATVLTVAQPTRLSWAVTDAAICWINNGVGVVPCTGDTIVTPGATLAYTLNATAGGPVARANVNISAGAPGRFIYAVNEVDENASMLSIGPLGALSTIGGGPIATGRSPFGIAVNAAGTFAYVANFDTDSISMYSIDDTTGELSDNGGQVAAGDAPRGIVVDPADRFVYAVNQSANFVSIYTVSDAGVLTANGTAATGTTPIDIDIDPLGRYAYVSNAGSDSLSMFEINTDGTLIFLGTTATGDSPRGVDVDPTGRFVYVGNGSTNSISMYEIQSDGRLGSLGTASFPDGNSRPIDLAVDPTGQYLYAVDSNNFINQIRMFTIDANTGLLADGGAIAAGGHPNAVAVDPGGEFVYVTNLEDDNISIYSINGDGTLTSEGTMTVGDGPVGLAISR